MASPILLPRQGQSVESCIISHFYLSPGDPVKTGDMLFSYETDKASFEEEAKEDGILLAWFFDEGDEVPVLTNVGVIGAEGEDVEAFRPTPGMTEQPEQTGQTKQTEQTEQTGSETLPMTGQSRQQTQSAASMGTASSTGIASSTGKAKISPRARKLAESKALDWEQLAGSGPGGRIIERDVQAALRDRPRMTPLAMEKARREGLAGSTVIGDDFEILPLSNIRKLIAKAMHQSLQNSAQLTHHLSADARRLLELRGKVKESLKEGQGQNLTLNDMICYAVVRALKEFPRANSHFLGDSLRQFSGVHLGLAVDTERGLMVPAIRDADKLSIGELSQRMSDRAESCRTGSIDPDLLSPEAASFTVSNLGNYGVEIFTPVINLPQVAILGVNTIVPRPKDTGDGNYEIVPHLGLSLSYDHQALDGGEATRFLRAIANEIENLEIEL